MNYSSTNNDHSNKEEKTILSVKIAACLLALISTYLCTSGILVSLVASVAAGLFLTIAIASLVLGPLIGEESADESKLAGFLKCAVALSLGVAPLLCVIFNVNFIIPLNLTFAVCLAVMAEIYIAQEVCQMCFKNKSLMLYPRLIYVHGLVAVITFAFLIAFKVVSLAVVAPLAVPSICVAFVCFMFCAQIHCKKKKRDFEFSMAIDNNRMTKENDASRNNRENPPNKSNNGYGYGEH